jgi:hypothetical protein
MEGILALFSGGTPVSTGFYQSEIYDRALSPPASNCSTVGAIALYAHEADINFKVLDGGGGINPDFIPRDPKKGCAPVYPHDFVRVNTAFEVVKAAGMRTAWADKHLTQELVHGPSGKGVDDLYIREINYEPEGTHGWVNKVNMSAKLSQPLDDMKVQAVINEIDGFDHSRTQRVGVPALFGTTFQAVTVAQLIQSGGYLDAYGTPSPVLLEEFNHTDQLIGKIVDELQAQGLLSSTLIVVTSIHGQTPIDRKKHSVIDAGAIAKLIGSDLAFQSTDTVDLIWLKDQTQTAKVVAKFNDPANRIAGIQDIIWGDSLKLMFPDPLEDSRVPDMILTGVAGAAFGNPHPADHVGFIAEHSSFAREDTNVPLLLSNPGLKPALIRTLLSTTEVAPTILQALGLDPQALEAVRTEKTRSLPGFFEEFSSKRGGSK